MHQKRLGGPYLHSHFEYTHRAIDVYMHDRHSSGGFRKVYDGLYLEFRAYYRDQWSELSVYRN